MRKIEIQGSKARRSVDLSRITTAPSKDPGSNKQDTAAVGIRCTIKKKTEAQSDMIMRLQEENTLLKEENR